MNLMIDLFFGNPVKREEWEELLKEAKTVKSLEEFDKALKDKHIVLKENYTCCMTCGHSEIEKEYKRAYDGYFRKHPDDNPIGPRTLGYTFYHYQNLFNAENDGKLYLCYGSFIEEEVSSVEVGKIIVECAKKVGIEVEWNESIKEKILLKGLDVNYFKLLKKSNKKLNIADHVSLEYLFGGSTEVDSPYDEDEEEDEEDEDEEHEEEEDYEEINSNPR